MRTRTHARAYMRTHMHASARARTHARTDLEGGCHDAAIVAAAAGADQREPVRVEQPASRLGDEPLLLARASSALFGGDLDSGSLDMIQRIILGALIIGFLIAEPDGLAALHERLRSGLAGRGKGNPTPVPR